MSVEEIVDVFEQMCSTPLEEDMVLFETGTFTAFSKEPFFQISLVRQFSNDDEEFYQIHVAETKAEDLITIENVSCVLDGDYYYYKGTINNNSRRTVSYVKYDIFMYNDEKKIIQTDWSNWTGTLPPGHLHQLIQ